MNTIRAVRLSAEPIVRPHMDERMGANINGPSLIRVPDWIEAPLGRYYLYFADHKGAYIRLAFADVLAGPWRVHTPGALALEASHFATERPAPGRVSEGVRREAARAIEQDYLHPHIASPDAHVDHERREIRMYYHGMLDDGEQRTRVAVSADGIAFEARPEILGNSYFRVFRRRGWHYALVMPGELRRSRDGLTGFESGPVLFRPEMRHAAVRCAGDALDVFWSRVGDAPERILHSRIRLDGDWTRWREEEARVVLEPELPWEGAGLDVEPSVRGEINRRVRQLRDPCVYEEDGRVYLLYCGGGESGIGIAEVQGLDHRHPREGGSPPASVDRASPSTGRISRRRSCRHSREGGSPSRR